MVDKGFGGIGKRGQQRPVAIQIRMGAHVHMGHNVLDAGFERAVFGQAGIRQVNATVDFF